MKHPSFFATIVFLLGPLACSSGMQTDTTSGAIESCFDTGGGHMRCVPTPAGPTKEPRDVDGDGKADTFVCATHPKSTREHADAGKGDLTETKRDGGARVKKGDDDDDCGKLGCRDIRVRRADNDDRDARKADDDDDEIGNRLRRDGGAKRDGGQGKHNSDDDDMICPSRDGGAREDGAGNTRDGNHPRG